MTYVYTSFSYDIFKSFGLKNKKAWPLQHTVNQYINNDYIAKD